MNDGGFQEDLGMRCAMKFRLSVPCLLIGSMTGLTVHAVPPEATLRALDRRALPAETVDLMGTVSSAGAAANGGFPSSGISLISQVTVTQLRGSLSATAANDIWGYVSPSGREYAIVGLNVGTAFVEVTDPQNPVVVATLSDSSSIWSDMKTYNQYAYNVNESGGGMQVIPLGTIDDGLVGLLTPLTASGLHTSHNLAINEDSGFAYLCGSNLAGGSLVAVDLSTPRTPVLAGAWPGPYVHDAQIVSYTEGPYAGREIAFCFCGASGLFTVDVTDKGNMFTIGSLLYPKGALTNNLNKLFL